MTILYVFRSIAYWGGIERILVDKMNYLTSVYGDEVYILTTDQAEHPIPYQIKPEVHVEDLNIRFYLQYRYNRLRRYFIVLRMIRLFKEKLLEHIRIIKPDIIVCTASNYIELNMLAKLKGDIPLIVESHSVLQRTIGKGELKYIYLNYMLRKGFKYASTIVTLTERDALDWRKIHPCVKVIPNVVHLNEGAVSHLDNNRIIWVGRLAPQKRPMEMIELWKSIYPKFPDWHLDIFGEGDQKECVEGAANSLGMNIHIYPPTSSIFDCYRNSSILVSTSLFEPFGLVIPEAMSCGLPIVAYDCSYGPASIIEDGINGFLVKMDDREMMKRKICMLMNDISLRRKMGEAAYKSSSRYSAELIMPLWKDLFHSLLTPKSI